MGLGTTAGRYAWRVRTAVEIRVFAANFVGAAVIFSYLTFLSPKGTSSRSPDNAAIYSIWFGGYWLLVLCTGWYRLRRRFRPVYSWLSAGREPTEAERRATLRQPARQALGSLTYWVGASALFTLLNVRYGETPATTQSTVVGIALAGLTSTALTFLLVERRMRKVFALALGGTTPTRRFALGVTFRLLLTWLLCSAVPLVGIGLSQVNTTPEERTKLLGPTWFLVGVGLATGLCATMISARSIADPLRRVRKALGEVQRGRTDVEVVVDDGGEVGLVQSGVNAMVAGLRERQLLQDLFGRHVGEEVARRALEEGVGLGGELLPGSALFVDLVGSTRLAEQVTPDEVVAVLNALFDAVVTAVTAEGGWVNKFAGDGALCVFGPPSGLPDHAAGALRAARALRPELERLARDHPGFDAGIGVSSGEVVAGNVGSEQRYEYTVIGDPVNEAARLTELAKTRPCRALASGAAVDAAGAEAEHWQPAGRLTLRGRGAQTEVYEPLA